MNTKKIIMLSMFVSIGVVISPLLRFEGFAPTQHFVNVCCSVFMGPMYSLLCAVLISAIRMITMGIPPLAITGSVFGAFLSGFLYEKFSKKLHFAVVGEIIGTGIIGSIASYPVMSIIMGKGGLSMFYYTPSFIIASTIGSVAAFVFLKALSRNHLFEKIKGFIYG